MSCKKLKLEFKVSFIFYLRKQKNLSIGLTKQKGKKPKAKGQHVTDIVDLVNCANIICHI